MSLRREPDLLRNELRDLKFNGFDLDLIGFEPDRLEDILAELGSGHEVCTTAEVVDVDWKTS